MKVANCESGLNPFAQGPTQDYGVFQIHAPSWESTAHSLGFSNYRIDPEQNIQMARHIYDSAGGTWTDWVCAWSKDHLAIVTR